jgi:protocatechuate 3,4-dioxygenase, beta subunit
MKPFSILILSTFSLLGCAQSNSQKPVTKSANTRHVGERCEGCEAIYESPIPFEKLSATDTLPDFNEPGSKLEISGIVYQSDGKTPAKDVIIYVYHTDQKGLYSTKKNDPDSYREGWGKRHGYIRGWMKTDKNGFYQFYTLKPAPYPGRKIPAHIHITVKEPDKNEYWIDEYLFGDDPLLSTEERQRQEKRGGNGIIKLVSDKGYLHGTRNILLGKNIPDYPVALNKNMNSGLAFLRKERSLPNSYDEAAVKTILQ